MKCTKVIKPIAHRSSCAWPRTAYDLQAEEPVLKVPGSFAQHLSNWGHHVALLYASGEGTAQITVFYSRRLESHAQTARPIRTGSFMNVVCYERGLLGTWSVMNVVCYERGLLWTWSAMNGSVTNVVCYERVCYERVCYERFCYERVCYERVCYERGLLSTCSVMILSTWSVMNVVCYEPVCYVRGLLWMCSAMDVVCYERGLSST